MSKQVIVYDTVTGAVLHTLTRDAEAAQFTAQEAQAFVDALVTEHDYENVTYLLVTAVEIIQPGKWDVDLDTLKLVRSEQIIYE
jgi:hypothetical protein